MSFLEVDIDELEALGRRLRALRDGFNTMGRDFNAYHEAIGSRRVNERLAEVAGNWTKHRQRIGADIEEAAAMAEAAAAQYRRTESDITGATHGS
jgi:hypothetical protein